MYCIYTYHIDIYHIFFSKSRICQTKEISLDFVSEACLSLLYSDIWALKMADFIPQISCLGLVFCVETCPDPLLHPKRRLRPKGYLKDNPKTADLVSRSFSEPQDARKMPWAKRISWGRLPLQPLIDLNWSGATESQDCWWDKTVGMAKILYSKPWLLGARLIDGHGFLHTSLFLGMLWCFTRWFQHDFGIFTTSWCPEFGTNPP